MAASEDNSTGAVERICLSPTRDRRFHPAAVSPARSRDARTKPLGISDADPIPAFNLRRAWYWNRCVERPGRSDHDRAKNLRSIVAVIDAHAGDPAHALPRVNA